MEPKTSNCLLGALIIQNSIAVLIARHVSTNFNYDVRKLLIIAEMVKLFLSCILESYTLRNAKKEDDHGNRRRNMSSGMENGLCTSLYRHIWQTPFDALKLSIPALLYALHNVLGFTAISMVPVPLFLIIQQTKLVMTTLLSIVLLRRSYSLVQWISILSLCLGSSICFFSVIYDGGNNDTNDENDAKIGKEEKIDEIEANVVDGDERSSVLRNFGVKFHIFGVLLIVIANFCAALAGVYFELVIKGVDKKSLEKKDRTDLNDNEDAIERESLLSKANDQDDDYEDTQKMIEMTDLQTLKTDSTSSGSSSEDSMEYNDDTATEKLVGNDSHEEKITTRIRQTTPKRKSDSKDQQQPSIWMRNIQLGFFTLCIITADMIIQGPKKGNDQTPIFGGEFHITVFIQIFLFAFGGLLIAAVIKNADNVQKGLCMGISVVLTCLLSMLMDQSIDGVSVQFLEGAMLAIGGCFFFANSTLVPFGRKHCVFYLVFLFMTAATIVRNNQVDLHPMKMTANQETGHRHLTEIIYDLKAEEMETNTDYSSVADDGMRRQLTSIYIDSSSDDVKVGHIRINGK